MSRRGWIWLAVATLVGQVVLGSAAPVVARQVDGNSYVSPTYGWSITWDDTWSVEDEGSDDGRDYLTLSGRTSTVYFSAFAGYDGDPEACVEDERDYLESIDGVDDVELMTDDDGEPLSGSDRTSAYGVYTFTLTDEDGNEWEVVDHNHCRTLVEGEAVLNVSMLAARDAYEDALPPFEALLDNLAMPGEEPARAPISSPWDEDLTAREMRELVETGSVGLIGWWTEVFADHDLFYVAPFFVVIEDETRIPCSEGTREPGDGSAYCPLNQTIYFDLEAELDDAEGYGRASVYYTLGHESGHDVQMQLGVTWSDILNVEQELEADCMAGAYLAWLVDADDLTEEEFFTVLELIKQFGDPEGIPATDVYAHGLGSQRVGMVLRGYYSGVDACGTF